MIWRGELLHIHVASTASAAMEERSEAVLLAGVGIEGDRYAAGLGAYSKRPHIDRQVTLIEVEVLEAIAREEGLQTVNEPLGAELPNRRRRDDSRA